MFNWKANIFKILLVISLIINIGLIIFKQINITNEYHQHQHQEQFQGQLQFNMYMAQGNELRWKVEEVFGEQEVANKLRNLPPQYSYFTKVVYVGRYYEKFLINPEHKFFIFIPEFLEKK